MIQRCTNPNHNQYKDYGGRGIVVCDEWWENFLQFALDMKPRPLDMTLDRRDPNGPYCLANCRWADAETQAQNRRKGKLQARVPIDIAVNKFVYSWTMLQDLAASVPIETPSPAETPQPGVGRGLARDSF